ncbi:MAG: hypothetical protein KDD45_00765 [Bdellovibrionales bacterium]|nr:hypothetical protein [Bdellovibrionales bacterium]
MKSLTQKILSLCFLSALIGGSMALADNTTPAPAVKGYFCAVLDVKTDGSAADVIHQDAFSWNTAAETSEIFFKEGNTAYSLYSEANSGVLSLGIINTETNAVTSAVSDLSKILLIFDSSHSRAFGCGAGTSGSVLSSLNTLSVK